MPSPEQLRRRRIDQLFKACNGINSVLVDPIITKAIELFPYLSDRKIKEYAKVVHRMLKKAKKERLKG